MDRIPSTVPQGGPRALHGDGLHGNRWRGGVGDFARQLEARAFGNARGVRPGFVHTGTPGQEQASDVIA
jgi:hypothetical protein